MVSSLYISATSVDIQLKASLVLEFRMDLNGETSGLHFSQSTSNPREDHRSRGSTSYRSACMLLFSVEIEVRPFKYLTDL